MDIDFDNLDEFFGEYEVPLDWVYRDVRVTPEMAQRLLDRIPREVDASSMAEKGQREYQSAQAKKLGVLMSQGHWVDNPQSNSLLVKSDGLIVEDGQHRLGGVIFSGIPRVFRLFFDVDPRTFANIDSGRRRTASQFLSGKHGSIRSTAADILRNLESLSGQYVSTENIRPSKGNVDDTLGYLGKNPDINAYLLEFAPTANTTAVRRRFKGTSSAALLAGGYVSGRPEEWWETVVNLADGGGAEDDNPVRALYRQEETSRTGVSIARAIRTAVDVRDGKKRRVLKLNSLEKFKVW